MLARMLGFAPCPSNVILLARQQNPKEKLEFGVGPFFHIPSEHHNFPKFLLQYLERPVPAHSQIQRILLKSVPQRRGCRFGSLSIRRKQRGQAHESAYTR